MKSGRFRRKVSVPRRRLRLNGFLNDDLKEDEAQEAALRNRKRGRAGDDGPGFTVQYVTIKKSKRLQMSGGLQYVWRVTHFPVQRKLMNRKLNARGKIMNRFIPESGFFPRDVSKLNHRYAYASIT